MSQIIKVEIPEFESKIVLVKARRPKYRTEKVKDSTGKVVTQKVLKNPRTAGKPKYWNVNGQTIYNGTLPPMQRARMMKKLKEYVESYIPKGLTIPKEWLGNIKISVEIHDILPSSRYWDCDNKWPWLKVFSDCLTEGGYIPDDNIQFVRSNGEVIYFSVTEEKERKLVFKIEKL